MARRDGKPCREKHPGVSHTHRAGYGHVVTYREVLTGKRRCKSLAALGVRSTDAACRWCVELSESERAHAAARAKNGGRAGYVSIAVARDPVAADAGGGLTAVDRYAAHLRAERTRDRTVETYLRDLARFAAWCRAHRVRNLLDVNVRHLQDFRQDVATARRQRSAKGAVRGARVAGEDQLSAVTVNRVLTSVRAFLNWARRSRYLDIGRDELGEALAHVKVAQESPQALTPTQVRALLEAAIAHDAETWDRTRREKEAGVAAGEGKTPRYCAIAPYLMFTLLCGCRRSEGLELRWDDVALDAVDGFGNPAPFVQLEGKATKTKRARRIALDVCPTVADLLRRLHNESGGRGYVFGAGGEELSGDALKASLARLAAAEGVPRSGPQRLRQTGESYLASASGIGLTPYMMAARYGHSLKTAETYYLSPVMGVPASARTLEAALGIEDVARRIAGQPRLATVRGIIDGAQRPAAAGA